MTKGRLLCLAALLLLASGRAQAADGEAPVGGIEAFVELPKEPPYVGEPLRLVLRSPVRGKIAADRILQPALTNFDWRQFGVDSSSEQLIDGFWTPVLERVLMIYPLEPGRLTIPPFTRRISYLTTDGGRAEIEFSSRPFEIEVRAHDGVGDPADPWLPAKRVGIADRWEPEPDRIPFGEMATRIVTVEAEGVTADRLPPLPNFRAPGVITFAGPVERSTITTDQGPIARAVYRWSVRPATATPAVAPAVRLRWFDISARTMREAVAPERRVAFIEQEQEEPAAKASGLVGLWSFRPLAAAFLSFVATFAIAHLALSSSAASKWLAFTRRPAALGALRRAARKGDLAGFRRAVGDLSKADRDRWQKIAAREDIAPGLAAIDAALFAREAGPPPIIGLTSLAQRIAGAWRDVARNRFGAASEQV
jgi:hypothetical protein